jgi:hypothetical protein
MEQQNGQATARPFSAIGINNRRAVFEPDYFEAVGSGTGLSESVRR